MRYKAVLFDMDDTLLKTWEAKWEQHKFVAKKYYGVELSDEVLMEHWGKGFDTLAANLYAQKGTEETRRTDFVRHEDDFPKKVHSGAVQAVEKLLAEGIAVGVVSAMLTQVVAKDMREQGFPHERFAVLQGSDHTKVHKPDPLVFDPALVRLADQGITDKRSILYVGDALNDFYAARDAGLDFIGITTGFVDKDSFVKAGAKKVIASLTELPALAFKKGKA